MKLKRLLFPAVFLGAVSANEVVLGMGYRPSKTVVTISYLPGTLERMFVYRKIGPNAAKRSSGVCSKDAIFDLDSKEKLELFLKNEITCTIVTQPQWQHDHFLLQFPFINSCDDVIDEFREFQRQKNVLKYRYHFKSGPIIFNHIAPRLVEVFEWGSGLHPQNIDYFEY